ncbi:MAG: hypothetical protein IJP72_04855 [Bacteroidales bacterium]|nr:hypothetical protein [Bacteroidales bacterium]
MKLIRYIVSVCLVLIAHSLSGCMWYETPVKELYLFKSYPRISDDDDSYNTDKEANLSFWYNYTGSHVRMDDVEKALYNSPVSGITDGTYAFFEYLKKQGDNDALDYWRMVKSFSKKTSDPWYYMSLADRKELQQMAVQLQENGAKCTHRGLKERYLLQLMRISFYLEDYHLCLQVKDLFPKKWQDANIGRKCTNYYAGALLHLGETVDAVDLYGSTGDWTSLQAVKGDINFLQKLYEAKPNSHAFEYYIQNFENRHQFESNAAERKEFVKLAEKILSEGKTDQTALWQSALAHLAFLDGDIEKAITLIEKAAKMKGTTAVMENVRMLRLLYYAADDQAANYDQRIATDLPWLLQKVAGLGDEIFGDWLGDNHYVNILRVVTLRYLEPHYSSMGNSTMALAILNAYAECKRSSYAKECREKNRKGDPDYGSYDYNNLFFHYMDTTSIQNVKDFLAFVKSGGNTNLEKSLIRMGYVGESLVNELIGTKYMRLRDFHTAATYLKKVRPGFLKTQNIYEYLQRNPFDEAWILNHSERQHYGQYNPAPDYATAPTKLHFCEIMMELEKRMETTADNMETADLHYAYSVGLTQMHDFCWALINYSQGSFYTEYDQEMYDSWDYLQTSSYNTQKILTCLKKALQLSTDDELSARCCYLNLYVEECDRMFQRIRGNISDKYGKTRFGRNEMSHCDILADYL